MTLRSEERLRIYCTHQFAAEHRWLQAPPEVKFLCFPHRHLFHVRVEWRVSHGDRQMEFLRMKGILARVCTDLSSDPSALEWSCEHYAEKIAAHLHADKVEVSEDGENGAVWERVWESVK